MLKTFRHKWRVFSRMVAIYKNWIRLTLYRLNGMPQSFIVRLRDGSRFRVRDRRQETSDAYVINECYLYGIHDRILPYIARVKVGIDVGAHIGSFSIFAAKRSPATIYAIEPAPNNVKILEENITLNHYKGRIIPISKAVAKMSGNALLYIPLDSGLISVNKKHLDLYQTGDAVRTVSVPAVSLADFFREKQISFCDFIKMDCEGAEYDIFYNLPEECFKKIGVMSKFSEMVKKVIDCCIE